MACIDVSDDVLEITVGLAMSRKVLLGGLGCMSSLFMWVDFVGILGEVGCDSDGR